MEKRLVISATIDNVKQYINLDLIDDVSISLSSVVSTYPLVEGDSISDHMYKQPNTISIAGTFGSKSKFSQGYEKDRLKTIQSLFERIKNERIFVDILSIYNVRNSYVLHGINWTEHANTIGYTFSFKEIYTAKVTELEYETDKSDDNLPDLTEPMQLDLTDTLIDWAEVDRMVVAALKDANLIDAEFLEGAGAALGAIVGGAGLAAAAIFFASNPIGWVAAGVGAVAFGIYTAITTVKKASAKKKYRVKEFKLYKDERQKKAEFDRFVDFVNSIHVQLEVLEYSGKVYSLSTNVRQECVLNIDGDYYIFNFEKNNSDGSWSMIVKDIELNLIKELPKMIGLGSLAEATKHNNLFTIATGTYVYLINTAISSNKYGSNTDSPIYYNDLRDYVFFITKVDMADWNNLLVDIITNALKV